MSTITAENFSNALLANVVDPIVAVLVMFSFFYFIVMIIKFISNPGDSSKRFESIRNILMVSFILFIITSIWLVFKFAGSIGGGEVGLERDSINLLRT